YIKRPYVVGWQYWKKVFIPSEPQISLQERFISLGLAILLICPFINTITWVCLQTFSNGPFYPSGYSTPEPDFPPPPVPIEPTRSPPPLRSQFSHLLPKQSHASTPIVSTRVRMTYVETFQGKETESVWEIDRRGKEIISAFGDSLEARTTVTY